MSRTTRRGFFAMLGLGAAGSALPDVKPGGWVVDPLRPVEYPDHIGEVGNPHCRECRSMQHLRWRGTSKPAELTEHHTESCSHYRGQS